MQDAKRLRKVNMRDARFACVLGVQSPLVVQSLFIRDQNQLFSPPAAIAVAA
jgi:hypothetical protein